VIRKEKSVFSSEGSVLVTGGAGFIGSNFVLAQAGKGHHIVNLDALTYAGNLRNLVAIKNSPQHTFVRGDILDGELLARLFGEHRPRAVVHFAAESHVDRSIHDPEQFVQTNVNGTARLLRAALAYWRTLNGPERDGFRFLHVSTDEVYGSLEPHEPAFTETTAYRPNSPYAASKAAADHLVRAYHHTYGLPVLMVNCSNNYGPFQFPEKLIPMMVVNALAGKALPVYGDGNNVRDWLYVEDHCAAIDLVLRGGRVGEGYNVGGASERTNLEVVGSICAVLDACHPEGAPHRKLVRMVADRPGHDRRYAIDSQKIQTELGWQPQESFASGIEKTVRWYVEHSDWVQEVTSGEYRNWITLNYAGRDARCGA
jgi:dTDP-glucose 4,6-dehydratase